MALMDDLRELHLQCANCGATLQYENGSFQDCPVCGTSPTEQQIRAAAYFQKVPQTGVVISHEFVKKGDQPPEFVFVHPMSGHIPNNSALIVEQFQKAVFTAAGTPQVLEVPNLYPIAGDERNEQELLKAIAAGERGQILQNISTRITFFDMRQHPCTSQVSTGLPGSAWRLSASVGYNMRIVDHTQLEQIAFDMKRSPEEVRLYIRDQIERAICDGLYDMIAGFDGLDLRPAQNGAAVTQRIKDKLRTGEVMQQLTDNVAAELRRQGFEIAAKRGLDIDWDSLACVDHSNLVEVRCTFTKDISGEDHDCPGTKLIPKGDRTSWVCPVCGQRLQWCNICGGFRTTCERARVCDKCRHVI